MSHISPWLLVDDCGEFAPGEYVVAYDGIGGMPPHRRVAYWSGGRWYAGDPRFAPILRAPDRVLRPHLGPVPDPPGDPEELVGSARGVTAQGRPVVFARLDAWDRPSRDVLLEKRGPDGWVCRLLDEVTGRACADYGATLERAIDQALDAWEGTGRESSAREAL